MKYLSKWLALVTSLALGVACSASTGGPLGSSSSPAAANPCPSAGTTLNYANFGQAFMTSYCTECHGGSRPAHNVALSSASGVHSASNQVLAVAAEGNSMPPSNAGAWPTQDERAQLQQWLACGAP